MAIYTPRGLKIRVSTSYAFGLMARLYPRVSAFRILKTTEGIELIPGIFSVIATVVAFMARLTPLQVSITVAAARVLGTVANGAGVFIPGMVDLATVVSYVTGWGAFNLAVIIVGAAVMGWAGPVAYVAGRLAGFVLAEGIEWYQCVRVHRLMGLAITASEQNFFSAYRLHASRLGVTTDIKLSETEVEPGNWQACYLDLAESYPEIVSRFIET